MILVSYGGGTNSKAVLIGLRERGIRPDVILFADTGGEKPHTYLDVQGTSAWCESVGFPEITTVRVSGELLYENCIRRKALPAVAYGYKTCSMRWKVDPQDKYMNNLPAALEHWANGGTIRKLIGFDAGEPHRQKDFSDGKYTTEYPLIKWGWRRADCIAAIERASLPLPGKSACFFCPNSRPSEIERLRQQYPELYVKAVDMEQNADLTSIKGLGRTWSWKDLGEQRLLFDYAPEMPCECFE